MNQFPVDTLVNIRAHLEARSHAYFRVFQVSVQDPFSDPGRTNDNAASDTEASEESNHDRVSARFRAAGTSGRCRKALSKLPMVRTGFVSYADS